MEKYSTYCDLILNATRNMREDGILDRTGGAVSIRTSDDNVVISSTGSSKRGWTFDAQNVTIIDGNGNLLQSNLPLAASGAPIHLEIYKRYPQVNAIVHAHSAHALAFASLGLEAPNAINLMDAVGRVPCLLSDDHNIKTKVLEGKVSVKVPSGIVQRPEIYAVNMTLVEQVRSAFDSRISQLPKRPLGFLLQRHGVFTFASELQFAVDAMYRIESSCRTAILAGFAAKVAQSNQV
jgi:ribulose-5-phosphate 4-epimerase/fuculose-1-phosphate aldolase